MDLPPFDIARARASLFGALLRARRQFGGATPALRDEDRELTYTELIRAAFALGWALKAQTRRGENVGVMLPTGAGATATFFALHAYGRVPAMLNFTAGAAALQSALHTARIKTILTARRFVEAGKFDGLIAELAPHARIVWLEDVRDNLPWTAKAAAAIGGALPFLIRARPEPEETAVILFTSGTEGEPKGVALSHVNLLANVEQVRAHLALYRSDKVFNPLPMFHSFGLTVGAIMPLLIGCKALLYPSPLHAGTIAKRIRELRATILLATDTFISQYARASEEGDLASLRLAVCGAERVRDETRQLVRRRCNMEILEGYGTTETAPVLAANTPDGNRPGTVGKFMAAIEYRVEPVQGIANAGLLFVRGPNVMQGYLDPATGQPVPPQDGWYDTGDVVSVDGEGFVAIRGRVKRFAKIGGETVSLAVVENCATALWPENLHAAVTLPDPRKGEQIVLVTDSLDARRDELVAWVHNHGVSELAVPRSIVHVAAVPLLGTGKIDYTAVKKLLDEIIAAPAL